MGLGLFLKLLSLGLSVWAFRYYWKHQPLLDPLEKEVRWMGSLASALFCGIVFWSFWLLPRPWVREHTPVFVAFFGPVVYLLIGFIFLPGISKKIARILRKRGIYHIGRQR